MTEQELDDPEGIVEKMMESLSHNTSYLQQYYAVPPFSNVREFLAYVARARGKLKKGGVPDMRAAACVVIQDFNQGMIPFYIKPPRRMLEQAQVMKLLIVVKMKIMEIIEELWKNHHQ